MLNKEGLAHAQSILQDVGMSSQEGKNFSASSATEKSKEKQLGFPGGSVVTNPPAHAVHAGLIPGLGRSPGEGNGNPLQYSCLGNPMNRGAWQATAHGSCKRLRCDLPTKQKFDI